MSDGDKPTGARFSWSQDADSCDGGDGQYLTVVIEDAGCGPYAVIRTRRWAVALDDGSIDALAEKIRWAIGQCRSAFDEPTSPAASDPKEGR